MNTGLLWYDPTPKPLSAKITEAAARFHARTGLTANCAHLPPSDVPETDKKETPTAAGCNLIASRLILPHHLWIGRKEAPMR